MAKGKADQAPPEESDEDPLAEVPPGPMSLAFASTVHASYAAGLIDAKHEAAIAQGALLARLLDLAPISPLAPKWMTEYRQVWSFLVGEDHDAPQTPTTPAGQLFAQIAALRDGGTG